MIVSYFTSVLIRKDQKLLNVNICDYAEYSHQIVTFDMLLAEGFEREDCSDGLFALRRDGRYLSTRPEGTMSLSETVEAWEMFRTISDVSFTTVPSLRRRLGIPKIIHQTENSETISEQFRDNVESLKKNNPGYVYRYWSEKDVHDFIYEVFGWEIYYKYLMINRQYGAARADLFRYLCIYKFGGIYLDMKSGADRPFDDILRPDDDIILSHWTNEEGSGFFNWGRRPEILHIERGEYLQWFLMASPGHPLIKKVIDQVLANISLYHRAIYGTGRFATFQVTGPTAFSRAIQPHKDNHNIRFIEFEEEGIIYDNIVDYKRSRNYVYLESDVVFNDK